ncbi:MAG: hypothetical protein WB609_11130 [Candidatus Cybelea sp.]
MACGISKLGLARSVAAGEEVILGSGTTATVRRSYPAGYHGSVEILLAGSKESEMAASLTLTNTQAGTQGKPAG